MTGQTTGSCWPEEEAGTSEGVPALVVNDVWKAFPGVQALSAVSLTMAAGEVHGLVGENGAGKSTLIKVIAGAHRPDSGDVRVYGKVLRPGDPRAQRDSGVAVIYQEPSIVPQMPALGNVFLGQQRTRGPFLAGRQLRERFYELASRLGLELNPATPAGQLSVANQQMLEVMRALEADHRLLIMDEPTAAIGPKERERLYEIVATLRTEGVAILYISHDLGEVLRLCDRVSVMRDGQLVETRAAADWSHESLVRAMVGRSVSKTERPMALDETSPVMLSIKQLSLLGVLEDISFEVRRGEVLGFAGLVGSGRTELLRSLAGLEPDARGEMEIDGHHLRWPRSVRAALAAGIALAPEDRKTQGLVLSLSAATNVVLSDMRPVTSAGWVDRERTRTVAAAAVEPIGFDVSRVEQLAGTFSGGNQQKLVVGKWLHRGPKVLLLDEPTRGIDVGAKAEMYSVVRSLAERGMGVVVVSSELEEVVALAHRVLVLVHGRLVASLTGEEATVEAVLGTIFGAASSG